MAYWQNIAKIAFPMCLSSILMLIGILINIRIVGLANSHYFYLLALYLPISYILIAIYESIRVCGLYSLSNNKGDSSLIHLIIIMTFSIVILALLFCLSYKEFCKVFSISSGDADYFFHYSLAMIMVGILAGIYYLFTASLYAFHQSKLALFLNILTTICNCFITYVAVKYWHQGLFSLVSAAIISYIAFGLPLAIGVTITQSISWKFSWQKFKGELAQFRVIAGPVFISYIATFLSMFLFNQIMANFGPTALAGFGLAMRIQSVVILPAFSIGISTAILQLKNNKKEGASIEKQGLLLALCFYALIAIALTWKSSNVLGWITQDPFIKDQALQYLKIVSPSFVGFGLMLTFISYLEQIGKGRLGLLLNSTWFALEILIGGALTLYLNSPISLYLVIAVMNFLSLIVVSQLSKKGTLL